jgi:hypothetical protein
VCWLSAEEKAAELQGIGAERARLAAREAEVILAFAADRPDDEGPAEGRPGARSRTWRKTDPEFPGVSESFPRELAIVLGVGRGTAARKLRRAFTLRYSLPLTEAAQRRGELDERRAQILADTLEHIGPAVAGRVEAIVLPEACELGFAALERASWRSCSKWTRGRLIRIARPPRPAPTCSSSPASTGGPRWARS